VTRHRVKYGDSSHTLTTIMDVGCGVPTTATVCLKDLNGAHLLNGTITGVTDAGGGTCTFAYTGHAVATGDIATVAGTTSYNAAQTVTGTGVGTFDATETYVADESGTYAITAAKATVMTPTTLSADATTGEGQLTLTSVANVDGEWRSHIRLGDSALGDGEDVVVTNKDETNKIAYLSDWLKFGHSKEAGGGAGATVTGRFLSYLFDASQADFTSGLDFNVIWELTDTDDPAWREDGEILKREPGFGGLEQKFRTLYPHYHTQIPAGEFDVYQDTAFDELRILFMWKAQRDVDKLVNADEIEPVLVRQIAYNIAAAGDDSWEKEQAVMKMERDDWLTRMSQARIWIDENQDDTKTDSEVQAMLPPIHRRRLF